MTCEDTVYPANQRNLENLCHDFSLWLGSIDDFWETQGPPTSQIISLKNRSSNTNYAQPYRRKCWKHNRFHKPVSTSSTRVKAFQPVLAYVSSYTWNISTVKIRWITGFSKSEWLKWTFRKMSYASMHKSDIGFFFDSQGHSMPELFQLCCLSLSW